jgi:NFU1 iron-sulfur cluster scaffold homolog, mitochondrial
MEINKGATTVYMEMTPNPNTMKFVANRLIVEGDYGCEYKSIEEATGSSMLAENLFNFPFVQNVFIIGNFVSITQNGTINFDFVNLELRELITEFLKTNDWAIEKELQEDTSQSTQSKDSLPTPNTEPQHKITSELDEKIVAILDEYVRPAVENDGGAIEFTSFKDGVVTVTLKGACSGCPSSTQTLKGGVESLLKSMLPEVTEVVAEL